MPKPLKRRLRHVIDELQAELEERRRELENEYERNHAARAHLALLDALAAVSEALGPLLATPGSQEAASDGSGATLALDSPEVSLKLDAAVTRFVRIVETSGGGGDGRCYSRGGSDGGCGWEAGAASDDEASAPIEPEVHGASGVLTSDFIRGIWAAFRGTSVEKEAYLARQQMDIHEAALLLHQLHKRTNPSLQEHLAAVLRRMGVTSIALCISRLWFFETFNVDLRTREAAAAPDDMWARTAESMQLTPAQDALFGVMTRWWVRHERRLQAKRAALAEAAIAAPADFGLQARVAEELSRVLHAYKTACIPFMVLMHTALLGPKQLAEYWVQPWPWMPALPPVLQALQTQRNAAAGNTAPAAVQAPPAVPPPAGLPPRTSRNRPPAQSQK